MIVIIIYEGSMTSEVMCCEKKMARSSQCDSVASYMDGIRVKIAEAYKPPRKVDLPTAYTKEMPDVENVVYDFRFERSILEKIQEWRDVKRSTLDSRNTRLETKRKKRMKDIPVDKNSQSTILTPQPLSPSSNDLQDRTKENGLDYADFDNDTSSPFDNMELKTINDMEELAQVLQPTTQCWAGPVNLEEDFNELILEEETEEKLETRRTVSDIMQELQKELSRPAKEVVTWTMYESEDEEGKMAKRLNDMGFSLSRSTRAVREFGGKDNKKLVEFLLAVQSLEDTGIPGDEAEKALINVEYDQEKAQIYYQNLCVLRDLGFPEEQASSALLKSNLDRDKALDLLVS